MADIFDQIAGEVTSPAVSVAPTTAPDIFDQVAEYSVANQPSVLEAIPSQIGKGVAFGYFDEIQGAEAGLQNLIANIFGRGNDLTFGQNYDKKVAEVRSMDDQFEAANPWGSLGLQAAGSILPILTTRGKVGSGPLSSLMTKVTGIGAKGAPTVKTLATTGALQGMLYGSGEADEGSRLLGAGIGGGVGAVAGPVVGKTIQYGTQALSDLLARVGILSPGRLAQQTGAINFGDDAARYTPEEIFLAKQLKNTPLDKIASGADELAV